MFLVHDKIEARHRYIARFLDNEDAPVAILLAAADFERCVRRGILGLGISPTKIIRETYFKSSFHGLDKFKEAWKAEVKPRTGRNLANDVVMHWSTFIDAYGFRHKLIHGATRKISPAFASEKARLILSASIAINKLATGHGVDLDKTIRRYKRFAA